MTNSELLDEYGLLDDDNNEKIKTINHDTQFFIDEMQSVPPQGLTWEQLMELAEMH